MMATTGKQNWIIINEAKVELFPKRINCRNIKDRGNELENWAYQPDFLCNICISFQWVVESNAAAHVLAVWRVANKQETNRGVRAYK